MMFPEKKEIEFIVNTYKNNGQERAAVATLKSGEIIIVWQSWQDGDEFGIYGQIFDQYGQRVGAEFQINTSTRDEQIRPVVSGLKNGGFLVVWDNGDSETDGNIYARRYNDFYQPIGNQVRINTSTGYLLTKPSITEQKNGNYLITWQGEGIDGYYTGIAGQIYSENHTRIGTEFQINTYWKHFQTHSATTALENGNFVVVWESSDQDGSKSGIFGQIFNTQGDKIGDEFMINVYTLESQSHPSITSLSNGNFIVVWQSKNQDQSSFGIFGRIFDAEGNSIKPEFQINTHITDSQQYPKVTTLKNGNYLIVWESRYQDGSEFGIYGQIFNVHNEPIGSEFQINTYTDNEQRFPCATTFLNNDFIAIWQSLNQDGNSYGIIAQRFWGTFLIQDYADTAKFNPSLLNQMRPILFDGPVTYPLNVVLTLSDTSAGLLSAPYDMQTGVWQTRGLRSEVETLISEITFRASENYQKSFDVNISISDDYFEYPPVSAVIHFSPNQPPYFITNFLDLEEEQIRTLSHEHILVADPDADDNDDLIEIIPDQISHGQFEFVAFPNVAITFFYQQNISNSEVVFRHDGSEYAPSYFLRASDGIATSAESPAIVLFMSYSDTPFVRNNQFFIREGERLLVTPSQLLAEDPDLDQIQSDLIFTVVARQHLSFELFNQTTTTFTQGDIWNKAVILIHDGTKYTPFFRFTVSDGAQSTGIINSNVTFSIYNDAVLENHQITINEGQTVILTSENFSAFDDDGVELIFRVQNVTHGQFELTAHSGIAITSFSETDIALNKVCFVHDGTEEAPTFSVMVDDGETGGEYFSGIVNFTLQNDLPVLVTKKITINEGETIVLTTVNIFATDVDNPNSDLIFLLSNINHCEFFHTNALDTPISEFSFSDIQNEKIGLTHDGGDTKLSFSITVSDGMATTTPTFADVTFIKINDAPVIQNCQMAIEENATIFITTNEISVSDPDTLPVDLLITVDDITHGQFENIDNPGVKIIAFSMQDILNQKIKFAHDHSEEAPTFSVSVSDGDITTAFVPATISFNQINDIPKLVNNRLKITEGETVIITSDNLSATDEDLSASELIYLVSEISAGFFNFISAPEIAITQFTGQQIFSSEVQFTHDGSDSIPGYKIALSDGENQTLPAYAYIDFIPVNDPPVLLRNSITISENGAIILTSNNIQATDPDNIDADLIFLVQDIFHGQFENSINSGVAITEFTQTQIEAGEIQFVHDGTEFPPTYTISVSDGNTITSPTSATIFFNNANSAPRIVKNSFSISEGETKLITLDDIDATDSDDNVDTLIFYVTNVEHGQFELTSIPGVAINEFARIQLANNQVQFVHDNSPETPRFQIYASDGESQSRTENSEIIFSRKNDAAFIHKRIVASEGEVTTITNEQISAYDPDGEISADSIIFSVQNVVHGKFEFATNPNVAIFTFSQNDINNGRIVFRHDNSEYPPSYEIKANDNISGGDYQIGEVYFISNDDPPSWINHQLVIEEGQQLLITPAELAVADSDTMDDYILFEVDEISNGHFADLRNNSFPVTQFTQRQIKQNQIVFIHDGCEEPPEAKIGVSSHGIMKLSPINLEMTFISVNDPPTIINPITTIEYLAEEIFMLNCANYFTDPDDSDDALQYYLGLQDEDSTSIITRGESQRLPSWLHFDPETKTLSGIAPAKDYIGLKLIAVDPHGDFREMPFNLKINDADYTWRDIFIGTGISVVLSGAFTLIKRHLNRKSRLLENLQSCKFSGTELQQMDPQSIIQRVLKRDLYPILKQKISDIDKNTGLEFFSWANHFVEELFQQIPNLFLTVQNLNGQYLLINRILTIIGDYLEKLDTALFLDDLDRNIGVFICAIRSVHQNPITASEQKWIYQELIIKPFAEELYRRLCDTLADEVFQFELPAGKKYLNFVASIHTRIKNQLGIEINAFNGAHIIDLIARAIESAARPSWSTRFFRFSSRITANDLITNEQTIIAEIQNIRQKGMWTENPLRRF